jgi:hypothetical protein
VLPLVADYLRVTNDDMQSPTTSAFSRQRVTEYHKVFTGDEFVAQVSTFVAKGTCTVQIVDTNNTTNLLTACTAVHSALSQLAAGYALLEHALAVTGTQLANASNGSQQAQVGRAITAGGQ